MSRSPARVPKTAIAIAHSQPGAVVAARVSLADDREDGEAQHDEAGALTDEEFAAAKAKALGI